MQLRTVKKPKSKAFDFGRETQADQSSVRKSSMNKEQELAGDSADSGGVGIFLYRTLSQMSLKKMRRKADTNCGTL